MKKNIISLAVAGLLLAGCGETSETDKTDATTTEPTVTENNTVTSTMTEAEKRSYALGVNSAGFVARGFQEFDSWGLSIDKELVKQGFIDMMDEKSQMSTEEIQAVLMNFQKEIQEKMAQIEQEQLEKSMAANKTFLEDHAKQDGVQITESGLQYRIITEGTGANPKPEDVVRVHYKGTLMDGTEFDSSYSRGQPLDFPLGRVIRGWVEGIQLVKEGGKIELVMGPELGYGDQASETIPANSVLVFEVELLKINPEPEQQPVAKPEETAEQAQETEKPTDG